MTTPNIQPPDGYQLVTEGNIEPGDKWPYFGVGGEIRWVAFCISFGRRIRKEPMGFVARPIPDHNPAKLTPEQWGASEGWRLLQVDEVTFEESMEATVCDVWDNWDTCGNQYWRSGAYGMLGRETYRTRLSRAELRAARGLQPEPQKGGEPDGISETSAPMGLVAKAPRPSNPGAGPAAEQSSVAGEFELWWREVGQYIDPDSEAVPWFDKRKGLAEFAFMCGLANGDTRAADPEKKRLRAELLKTGETLVLAETGRDRLAADKAALEAEVARLKAAYDAVQERNRLAAAEIERLTSERYDALAREKGALLSVENSAKEIKTTSEFCSQTIAERDAEKQRADKMNKAFQSKSKECEIMEAEWLKEKHRADRADRLLGLVAEGMHAPDSDSPIAACNCDTKSPDIQYHRKGCRYRLIVERNDLRQQLEGARAATRLAMGLSKEKEKDHITALARVESKMATVARLREALECIRAIGPVPEVASIIEKALAKGEEVKS